ncbi:hypothetical protein H4Q26_008866 [Puccinia striiformis f. sp. tritici PST-130]|nr:hypothetical protein H4Q26_008866 [Puccinia striiformis f. sp. tritici PST-130]
MLPINQSSLSLLRSSSRTALPKRKCSELITFSRGAKMWVPAPEKIKKEDDNVASLLDSLRLIKAVKIDQPDLPIELTIEPLMKKTVNLNVMKGRFVLANQVPSPATSSSSGRGNQTGKDVIAVILDEESTDDVRLAKELGVDHFGGKDLLDRCGEQEDVIQDFITVESNYPIGEARNDVRELERVIMNSKNSIDWLVKKKPTANNDKPTNHQMVLRHLQSKPLKQNISDFLSMISNLTQFGTSSTSNTPKSTTSTPGLQTTLIITMKRNLNPTSNLVDRSKNLLFSSPLKLSTAGIHKATLTVKGIPAITVI